MRIRFIFYNLSKHTDSNAICILVSTLSWNHFANQISNIPLIIFLKQFEQDELITLLLMEYPSHDELKFKPFLIKLIGTLISITRNISDYFSIIDDYYDEIPIKNEDLMKRMKNISQKYGELDQSFFNSKNDEFSVYEKFVLLSCYICSNVQKKKRKIEREKKEKIQKTKITKPEDEKEEFLQFTIFEMMGNLLHLTKEYYNSEEKSILWCSIDPISILFGLISKDYVQLNSSKDAMTKKFSCDLDERDAVDIGKSVNVDIFKYF
jgi:hypothetical protein